MRTLKVIIAAGASEELAIKGDYVRLRAAPYDVTIENIQTGEIVEGSQGDDFELSPFNTIRVKNLGASEATFKITVATGKRAGSAPGVISGSVAVSANPVGAIFQDSITVTNVDQVILPANAVRKYLLIQNNDTSAALRVTLDGSVATATHGFKIPAGDSLELSNFQCTGAIHAITEAIGSGADNVEVAEG